MTTAPRRTRHQQTTREQRLVRLDLRRQALIALAAADARRLAEIR
jgi:hypothetical protein